MTVKKLQVAIEGQARRTVPLYDIASSESLTPRLARYALRVAAGKDAYGEVWDDASGIGIGYRVDAHSTRMVPLNGLMLRRC